MGRLSPLALPLLLAMNGAAILALTWYARRTRSLQFEIAEMILMGVIIDPASSEAA